MLDACVRGRVLWLRRSCQLSFRKKQTACGDSDEESWRTSQYPKSSPNSVIAIRQSQGPIQCNLTNAQTPDAGVQGLGRRSERRGFGQNGKQVGGHEDAGEDWGLETGDWRPGVRSAASVLAGQPVLILACRLLPCVLCGLELVWQAWEREQDANLGLGLGWVRPRDNGESGYEGVEGVDGVEEAGLPRFRDNLGRLI